MRCLDSITNSMDMSLREPMFSPKQGDSEGEGSLVHEVAKSRTRLSD